MHVLHRAGSPHFVIYVAEDALIGTGSAGLPKLCNQFRFDLLPRTDFIVHGTFS
jgi:hypothetical protein